MISVTRRRFLNSCGAAAILLGLPKQIASAWTHGIAIPRGWNVLNFGCGGLSTGMDIASDGTVVVRTDVGNAYIFDGGTSQFSNPAKSWRALMSYSSLGNGYVDGAANGCFDIRIANSRTTNLYAFFPQNNNFNDGDYALYYSTNSGVTWTATSIVTRIPQGSNGIWKNTNKCIAIDPINENVVYVGMMDNQLSGASGGIYRATDGVTFNVATLDGSTSWPAATKQPGGCGICFDPSQGTVVVGGQTRTKRILIPSGGNGIYESTDGGQHFTETFTATAGRSDIAVVKMFLDNAGVAYAFVNYASTTASAHLWRYRAGTWVELSAQANWPYGGGVLSDATSVGLVVDPRSGHEGFVSIYGPNGIGVGFTSTNANNATASAVTWAGSTGGQQTSLTAPSYDCGYLNFIIANGTGDFAFGSESVIDQSGNYWWTGSQGLIWRFTLADLSTSTIPNYGVSTVTYSVTISRGSEATVAQEVIRPPGGTFPLMAKQDVGYNVGTFSPTSYPTSWVPHPTRSDATSISYAPGVPSFVAARITKEATIPSLCGFSGYSIDYGVTINQYAAQPDPLYEGHFTSSVSGTTLTVTAVSSGNIVPGGRLFTNGSFSGGGDANILSQLTNTNGSSIPWREGTYSLDTNLGTIGSTSMAQYNLTVGGQIVAVDANHQIVIPYNSAQPGTLVAYTANQGASWQFASGLSPFNWTRRGYAFGTAAKPCAADQVNIGTVFLFAADGSGASASALWKSTDSGASWSVRKSGITFGAGGGGNFTEPLVYAVPGHAGHLFVTSFFTSGTNAKFYFYDDSTNTFTDVNTPSTFNIPVRFAIGAPQSGYPALYMLGWNGSTPQATNVKLFKGIFDSGTKTATWSTFGPTGLPADFPWNCQFLPFQTLTADPVTPDLLYVASGAQMGFAWYNP